MSDRDRIISIQLAAQGLRVAGPRERGWIVILLVEGESLRVWATDGRGS